jgi:hypothetical protein
MWKAAFILAGDSGREPSRPLAVARVLAGSAALLQTPGLRSQLASLLAPGTFRAPYAISPPMSAAWVPVVICLMAVLAAAAIVGWQTRIVLAGLAATIAFPMALDQQLYRNDLYLLFLECCLLCLAGSGAALSLDAWRGGGKDFVDRWPVFLLKIQLSIIYASTAIAKINPSFLRGEVLQVSLRFAEVPGKLAIVLSLVTIGAECFLALALWFRVTRRPAMLVGFLLHSSFVVLLDWGPQLVAFELEMLALYVLFPRIRPREYLVVYDGQSPFIRTCMKWCRRLDWLRACRLDPRSDPGDAASLGLEVVHGSRRFSGFEALREIAHILPSTWFLAPALSLPGLASLGDRVYRSLIARGCPALPAV